MSDDQISIEVDGKSVKAKKGQMIIEATDEHGSYVPRFCSVSYTHLTLPTILLV